MAAPRKPKKVFIQFAVALVVAAVLGIGAVVAGFTIIMGVSTQAQKAQEDAQKLKAEAEIKLKEIEDKKKTAEAEPEIVTFTTVQALGEIKPGDSVTKNMVTLVETRERPVSNVVTQLSQAVGKIAKVRIIEGETLDMNKLLDSSSVLSIDNGMRAITIDVDNVGSLNGALMPGMRVDVLATVKKDKDDKIITRTVLQNIQVMSVSGGLALAQAAAALKSPNGGPAPALPPTSSGGGNNSGQAVTLSVTPKQAELLTLATQTSQIHLALRNYNDKQVSKVAGADLTALMTGIQSDALNKPLPKLPPEPMGMRGQNGFHNVNYTPGGNLPTPPDIAGTIKPKFSMQIYRGSGTESVDFEQ